ncbi:MAG: hypothetical protein FJ088_08155, partial [Deltaproteobacteria bacterium]|nr:hypothetical protein [Deltaproteobacteria bacterium]
MKLVSVSIAILLSFALINCGGDDKGGTTPQENTSQAAELSIVITSPTGTGSFTTIDSSVTVEGQAMGPVEKVEWSVAGGDSGTADGTVNWTIKNLSLELGENLLTVKATGGGQEDSAQLLIVRNENVNYLSTPFLKPDTVFVNAAEEVVVTVEIDQNDKYDPATVKLIKVKSDNTTEELKAMTDDGDVINGDDIAGDGVYSAALFFTEAAAGDIMIKVSAQPKGGGDPEFSPPAFLHVIEQLTNDQNQEMLNVLDKAQKLYEEKVVELGHDKAKEEVLKLLEGDPVVDEAGSSEEGRGLWAIFKYGVIGVWEFNEEGEKGGGMKYGNAAPRYDFRASSKNPVVRNAAPSQFLDSVQFSATEDVNKINNTGAIVIGAFLAQFGADDDAPAVLEILKKSECPKFQID